jgi:hypothetical protein
MQPFLQLLNTSKHKLTTGSLPNTMATWVVIYCLLSSSPGWTRLDTIDVIRPHHGIEPAFFMLAGVTASMSQQIILHPLNLVQSIHYESLADLDKESKVGRPKSAILRTYIDAYKDTYQKCSVHIQRAGSWRRRLYRGFLINTIKQGSSTSAGFVIFELVRRRYGSEIEAVRIEKDGYDLPRRELHEERLGSTRPCCISTGLVVRYITSFMVEGQGCVCFRYVPCEAT